MATIHRPVLPHTLYWPPHSGQSYNKHCSGQQPQACLTTHLVLDTTPRPVLPHLVPSTKLRPLLTHTLYTQASLTTHHVLATTFRPVLAHIVLDTPSGKGYHTSCTGHHTQLHCAFKVQIRLAFIFVSLSHPKAPLCSCLSWPEQKLATLHWRQGQSPQSNVVFTGG